MTTVVSTSGTTTTISTVITSEEKAMEERPMSRGSSPPPAHDRLSESHSTPKFHSPLLQHLVESKSTENLSSERPKFKSPILQSLLGKNKLKKSDGKEEKSVIFALEKDVSNGVGKNVSGDTQKDMSDSIAQDVSGDTQKDVSDSVGKDVSGDIQKDECNKTENVVVSSIEDNTPDVVLKDEDKDVDTSESQPTTVAASQSDVSVSGEHVIEKAEVVVVDSVTESPAAVRNGLQEFDPFTNVMMTSSNLSDVVITSSNLTDEDKTLKSGTDSGILVDLGTSGSGLTSSFNGLTHNGVFETSQELADSR